jgi:hypothetical protein
MIRTSRGSMVDSSIQRLLELRINLLAIDFDLTMIDVHTGGRYAGTADELAKHVRSEMRQLLHACVEHGIHIAIVTFSGQTEHVRGVIEHVVGMEQAARIPIRGRDRTWSYRGQGMKDGKQPYIASAVEELESKGNVEITRNTTLLIDDDQENVRKALQDGTRAIWFNPSKPWHLFRDMSILV